MRTWMVSLTAAAAGVAGFLVPVSVGAQARAVPEVTVVTSGLNNPRGLAFGPDGALYVAEGGTGGTASTIGKCPQVPAPVGPYTGGFTASIARISAQGTSTVVASGLPSSQTSPATGSVVSGVAEVG